jgi:hypothetical protein
MQADAKAPRFFLLSVLFLFVVAFVPVQAAPQGAGKSAQTASAPTAGAPSPGSLQVRGSGNLQALSRGDLQRMGEDAALEDDTKHKRRTLKARL